MDSSRSPEGPPRHVVCAGAVVLQGNRALLVRQASGHPLEGQWTIPWGFVEPKESPESCAIRETLEESGVEAELCGLLGIQRLPDQAWMALVFLCRHRSGVPAGDGGSETDDARYFTLADLDAHPEPVEVWCEWLVRRVLQRQYHLVPLAPGTPYQPCTAFL
jgi:ADP-ribose pyrophosphatase YjhB (NUDIX family)